MTAFDPRATTRAMVGEAKEQATKPAGVDQPPIEAIDLANASAPGPFQWAVRDWAPCGRVSGLWGAGGGGKSTIAQLLLSCCVARQQWFGLDVEPGPALGFFTEDDKDDLLRRQFRINQALGITMADLAGKLHLIPRLGMPNTLAVNRGGDLEITPLFEDLRQKVLDCKPKIAAVDNLMQVYGAEQANANHIAGFVNALAGVAGKINGAILLLGHPGKAQGNEYAGPYAWDASVRSRMFLEETTGGVRKLSKRKANFAAKDEFIELEWRNGLCLPVDPARMTYGERLDADMRRGAACQEFLDALDRTTKQGINLSDSKRAPNYAPRTMVDRGYVNGFTPREMERAMLDLLDNGRIVIRLMASLETMGYFSDAAGSQRYPPLFRHFYPDRGNFSGWCRTSTRVRPCCDWPRRFAQPPISRSSTRRPFAGSRGLPGATIARSGARAIRRS
jgi:hypothetical protein